MGRATPLLPLCTTGGMLRGDLYTLKTDPKLFFVPMSRPDPRIATFTCKTGFTLHGQ